MTATLTFTRPVAGAAPAPADDHGHHTAHPALVDDLGEYEACMTILPVLTDPDDRALHLHMAAYWAERCARVVCDVDPAAHDEWVTIARVCQAVAATQRGFVLPGAAAWMDDPHWDALAAGECDRAVTLRALYAVVSPMISPGAAGVLLRIAASEPVEARCSHDSPWS